MISAKRDQRQNPARNSASVFNQYLNNEELKQNDFFSFNEDTVLIKKQDQSNQIDVSSFNQHLNLGFPYDRYAYNSSNLDSSYQRYLSSPYQNNSSPQKINQSLQQQKLLRMPQQKSPLAIKSLLQKNQGSNDEDIQEDDSQNSVDEQIPKEDQGQIDETVVPRKIATVFQSQEFKSPKTYGMYGSAQKYSRQQPQQFIANLNKFLNPQYTGQDKSPLLLLKPTTKNPPLINSDKDKPFTEETEKIIAKVVLKYMDKLTSNDQKTKPYITLKSKEGKLLKVEQRIAFQSQLIKNMVEDRISQDEISEQHDEQTIPLNFDEKTLKKVVEFMRYELENEALPEIPRPVPTDKLSDCIPQWFANFINLPNVEDVYDIIAAANYLDVANLVELGCAKVGSLMKNKTIPQLRQMFNIVNDFTPEEEKTIIEGKADIWGDEDDEGDEREQTVMNNSSGPRKRPVQEEAKYPQ